MILIKEQIEIIRDAHAAVDDIYALEIVVICDLALIGLEMQSKTIGTYKDGYEAGLDAAADYIESIGEYGYKYIATEIRAMPCGEFPA